MQLLEPYQIGDLRLPNRLVMAPMSRAGTLITAGGYTLETAEI